MNTILFETEANKRASDARLAKSKKQVADHMVILVEELESLNEQLIENKVEQSIYKRLNMFSDETQEAARKVLDMVIEREKDIRMAITNKKNYLIVLIESQAQ
jgi:hypothetical protein